MKTARRRRCEARTVLQNDHLQAVQRKVQTGRRVGERVEVLEGVKADEPVAVQGAGFLNEADLVKVVK